MRGPVVALLASAALLAPASAHATAGSIVVPAGGASGCDQSVGVFWDTQHNPPVWAQASGLVCLGPTMCTWDKSVLTALNYVNCRLREWLIPRP